MKLLRCCLRRCLRTTQVCLDLFGRVWICLDLLGFYVGTCLDLLGPIWICLDFMLGPVWTCLDLFGFYVGTCLDLLGPIWTCLDFMFGTVWTCLDLCWPVWTCVDVAKVSLNLCKLLSDFFGICNFFVGLGSVWTFLGFVCILWWDLSGSDVQFYVLDVQFFFFGRPKNFWTSPPQKIGSTWFLTPSYQVKPILSTNKSSMSN